MKIISVVNQKGGVGKTTTAVNLCAALSEKGVSTLLIDLDPQANATSGLGFQQKARTSIYPALIGDRNVAELAQPTIFPGFHFIPSEIDLAGCEIELARMEDPLIRLRQVLAPLRENPAFRFIVLDCPPSLGILMTNALAAADRLLVPLQCEFYALEGIQKIFDLTARMRGVNPDLDIIGVLMTMYDTRTRLSQQVLEDVQKHLPEKIFKTIIPRSVRLSEAPGFGKPITTYDSDSVGAAAYRQFAEEFMERVKQYAPMNVCGVN
ncbi:MAG: ParA family protein [bacterium]